MDFTVQLNQSENDRKLRDWQILGFCLRAEKSAKLKGGGDIGGARGVMIIVAGIGHGDTSSNSGLNAFHIALIPLGKVWIQLFSLQLWVNSRAD